MADFDFGGLLGNAFGANSGSELEKLLTAQQRQNLGTQSALSAAAALLQAGGRGPQRISLGQALGSALQAGQQGYQQARAASLQDLLLGQKLQEAKSAQELQTQLGSIFTKPTTALTPEQQALAMPGMQAGPTMARAELAANIPQPSDGEIKAAQYQRAADLLASRGKSEEAKRYQDMARELNPRAEVVGQPFEVTDATGKPIMVQQFKSGEIKTMAGFGPKRDVVLQNLGGMTVAIDKSKLTGNEQFAQTMTPSEIANLKVAQGNLAVAQGGLNLRQQEFARGAFDIKETPEGLAYVPKAPGGAAVPVMTAAGTQLEGAGSKPTEDQSKSAGFAFRMKQSTAIFNQPAVDKSGEPIIDPKTGKPVTLEQAYGQPGKYQSIMRAIPSAGLTTGIANVTEDVGRQQYRQAQENWVTANLRPESGAVIGADEMEKEIQKYFPQTNDDPKTIEQKSRARRDTELAMTVRAGPAYKQVEKAVAARQQPTGPRLVKDPATGLYRYVME